MKKNVEKGLRLLREACGESWSESWVLLGDVYRCGCGVEQNFDTAVIHYNRAIEINCGGTDLAYLYLGEMLEADQGTAHMNHDLYYYYKHAADSFNPIAQWKLGRMFENGNIVETNVPRAFEYFKLSARGGHIEAQKVPGNYLADIVERPRITVGSVIEDAAERYASKKVMGQNKLIQNLGLE